MAHLCVEQGALLAYFPLDDFCLKHYARTGKFPFIDHYLFSTVCILGQDPSLIDTIRNYLIQAQLFSDNNQHERIAYSDVYEFDLCTVVPSCSGPKRAQDKVSLCSMKSDFRECLTAPSGFKV